MSAAPAERSRNSRSFKQFNPEFAIWSILALVVFVVVIWKLREFASSNFNAGGAVLSSRNFRTSGAALGGHNVEYSYIFGGDSRLLCIVIVPGPRGTGYSKFDEALSTGRGLGIAQDRMVWNGRIEPLEGRRRLFILSKGSALHAITLSDAEWSALTPQNVGWQLRAMPLWRERIQPIIDAEEWNNLR